MNAGQNPPRGPPLPAGLLACWGIPPWARLTAAHGTNDQTFVVSAGSARWVLRISQNLTAAQVRAEHRLLARLRQAGLPFAVPEPVPTLAGDLLAETAAGPATVTKWLPGVRPDLSEQQALARFGRAIGQLSAALGRVPRQDAPHDWLTSPHVHPDVPDVAELCRELAAAGISSDRTRLLMSFKQGTWLTGAGAGLPVQVVHGDVAVTVDRKTSRVTAALTNAGRVGVSFSVYPDNYLAFTPAPVTVLKSAPGSYVWDATQTNGNYAFSVYGPDGFLTSFAGQVVPAGQNAGQVPVVSAALQPGARTVELTLANDGHEQILYTVTPNDYEGHTEVVSVKHGSPRTISWPTDQHGYYDVVITANTTDGFRRRYAGRIA